MHALLLLQTGAAYAKAGEHEAAEAAYSRAQEQGARLMKDVQDTNVTQAQLCDIMTGCMDLILDRLTNAWKLHQTVTHMTCNLILQELWDACQTAGQCSGTHACCAQTSAFRPLCSQVEALTTSHAVKGNLSIHDDMWHQFQG